MALNDILILPSKKTEGLENDNERSFETPEPEKYQVGQTLVLQSPAENDI